MLTAVKLMYAGAAVSTVYLITSPAIAIGDIEAAAHGRWLGHSLTVACPSPSSGAPGPGWRPSAP